MSVLHNDLLRALREAGPEGIPESEMPSHGGGWWPRHVRDINRWKWGVISWFMADGEKRFVLTWEPVVERTTGTTVSTFPVEEIEGSPVSGSLNNRRDGVERAGDMGGDGGESSVAGSLSPEQDTLFRASQSHFREAA